MRIATLLPVFLSLCISQNLFSQKKYSLAEALREGVVSLRMAAEGGHDGQSLALHFEKTGSKPIEITVAAGQLFEPSDSSLQTLVCVREEVFVLKNEKSLVRVFGKCAQANDGSPARADFFSLGEMATGALLTVAKFISEKNLHRTGDAQSAIWAVTNGHPVASIGHPALLAATCAALAVPLPEYKIVESPKSHALTSRSLTSRRRPAIEDYKPMRVEGEFKFQSNTERKLRAYVLNAAGDEVREIFAERVHRAGWATYKFMFQTSKLPRGEYDVCLAADGLVVRRIHVRY